MAKEKTQIRVTILHVQKVFRVITYLFHSFLKVFLPNASKDEDLVYLGVVNCGEIDGVWIINLIFVSF